MYITNGLASNVNSSLELSRRLGAAGHEVAYAGPAECGPQLVDNGYRFLPLRDDRCIAEGGMIAGIVAATQPQFILIDIELHAIVIVCMRLQIPLALTMVWFSIFRDEKLPPLHSTRFPPANAKEHAFNHDAWTREQRKKRHRRIKNTARHSVRRLLAPRRLSYATMDIGELGFIARRNGLRLGALVDYRHWLRPFVFKSIPVLCFNGAELDFPHTPDERLHYVGPMVHPQRIDPTSQSEPQRRLLELLKRYDDRSEVRPLVYCSLGSYWKTNADFIRRVIDVFKKRREWRLVIGLGNQTSRSEFDSLPDNVLAVDWAPQLRVLEKASAAITHGGITSINECIAMQVPMAVFSTQHGDQNGCAARVAWHGVGVVGNIHRDGAEQIAQHLESIIGRRSVATRIANMQCSLKRYADENTAAQVVERLRADALKHSGSGASP